MLGVNEINERKCYILTSLFLKKNYVNAGYLAHALIRECSISSACAILSRRRRNFFCSPCTTIGENDFFALFSNFEFF